MSLAGLRRQRIVWSASVLGLWLAASEAHAQAAPQPHAVFTIVRPYYVGPTELSNAPLTTTPIHWNPPTAWINKPSPLNNNLPVVQWLEPPPLVATFDHEPAADWGNFTSPETDAAMAPDAWMAPYNGATDGELYARNNGGFPTTASYPAPSAMPSSASAPGSVRRKALGW